MCFAALKAAKSWNRKAWRGVSASEAIFNPSILLFRLHPDVPYLCSPYHYLASVKPAHTPLPLIFILKCSITHSQISQKHKFKQKENCLWNTDTSKLRIKLSQSLEKRIVPLWFQPPHHLCRTDHCGPKPFWTAANLLMQSQIEAELHKQRHQKWV